MTINIKRFSGRVNVPGCTPTPTPKGNTGHAAAFKARLAYNVVLQHASGESTVVPISFKPLSRSLSIDLTAASFPQCTATSAAW